MAARSKASVCGCSLGGIAGSNSGYGAGMSVTCQCCVKPGRDLCVGPITNAEDFCRMCVCVCVTECDQGLE